MADTVRVRSLSIFAGSAEGRTVLMGEEFDVTPSRAAELEANGLVQRIDGGEKSLVAGSSGQDEPETEQPSRPRPARQKKAAD